MTTKPKTSELPGITGPGVARTSIAAVDALVEKYVAARDARMQLTTREVAAKQALIVALRANVKPINDDFIVYHHNDLVVTLKHGKDELKVKNTEHENNEN
jgi:hypothetical protein